MEVKKRTFLGISSGRMKLDAATKRKAVAMTKKKAPIPAHRKTTAEIVGIPLQSVEAFPSRLASLVSRHLDLVNGLTVPCAGGLRVAEIHAPIALSESADELDREVLLAQLALRSPHEDLKEAAAGVYVGSTPIGGDGIDARFYSILSSISTALDSSRSSGGGYRYRFNEVISAEVCHRMTSALAVLQALSVDRWGLDASSGSIPSSDGINWVSAQRAAAIEDITTATLRNYRCQGEKRENRLAGIDPYGRKWRRRHENGHTMYFMPSLKRAFGKPPQ